LRKSGSAAFFGGWTIIVRGGERFAKEEAAEIQGGDVLSMEAEGLPSTVRGLIDYPLERPCLFTIDVGAEPEKRLIYPHVGS
jgi:hypothetical protein